jgi:hypothetical protein
MDMKHYEKIKLMLNWQSYKKWENSKPDQLRKPAKPKDEQSQK